jgi:adenylate kinase
MTATYSSLNLVLLGPPGSGKTTQAERLASSYQLPHVVTRDMLRREVERQTAAGREAALSLSSGDLVSDRVLAGLILQRIDREDCARGFILDGYPRTVAQAVLLDGILAELGRSIERVVLIDVAPEIGLERLVAVADSEDDPTPGGLDRRELIRGRLRVWQDNAGAVVDFYQSRGLLLTVNGNQPVERVSEALLRAVGAPVGA